MNGTAANTAGNNMGNDEILKQALNFYGINLQDAIRGKNENAKNQTIGE